VENKVLVALVVKAKDFAKRHGLSYRDGAVAPWGSWDLVIHVPGQKQFVITGQTFGKAFSFDEGLALFFHRIANDKLSLVELDAFKQYMGGGQIEEIKTLFKDKAPELKKD
jgi:hypothetical protein